jgi:hypothetical protein
MSKSTKRINLSVPTEYHTQLHYVSRRLGISATSLIHRMTYEALQHMYSIVRQLPEGGSGGPEFIRRLRGESISYIESQYQGLKSQLGDEGE